MDLHQVFNLKDEPQKSEATVQEQAGIATNFYNNQFEKELQKMIFNVYESIGRNNLSFEYIKGTLNGLQLVVDYFQLKKGITKNINNKEE
jgi:hypothetical protein